MEKEKQASIRHQLCVNKQGKDCPVRLLISRTLEEGSISAIREASLKLSLIPKNDFYGEGLSDQLLANIEDKIFTADCTLGAIEGANYTNCGSIYAVALNDDTSGDEKLAVGVVRLRWLLNNPVYFISSNP